MGESPVTGDAPADDGGEISENADLSRLVERFGDEVAGLRAEFAAKIRYDEVKERQIAVLHEELQAFRAGLHLRLLQPVFTDLIAMYDDLTTMISVGNAAPELASFKDSVLETLSRNGVSSYLGSPEVETARQKVIRVETTSDESLDRHVQERIRVGFEYDSGKVLRPEWVAAYRYVPVVAHEEDVAAATGGE